MSDEPKAPEQDVKPAEQEAPVATATVTDSAGRQQQVDLETLRVNLEITKRQLDVRLAAADLQTKELALEEKRLDAENVAASADRNRVMTFIGKVGEAEVAQAMMALERWSRRDPGEPITVIFNSPGGSVIDGLALYDTLLDLRSRGHHVTTIARGQAASMGGILLQAGTERVMSANAMMLIHEARYGSQGTTSAISDSVDWVHMLEKRLLGILAERSKLTPAQIKEKWARRDWWITSTQAKRLGFCDVLA